MTTIARVAQEAGVGVGTVSRVINGSASVSEATRRRVLDVVAELGYEPNATARALSTGRTRSVGVIAPFFTRPSVIERLRGVAPLLATSGYQLVLFDVERPEQRTDVFRSVIGRVDGLLSISLAPPKAELRRLAAAGIPVVLVDQAHDGVPTVDPSTTSRGGRLATKHLLELGHRRIAFAGDTVDGVHGASASSRRCVGYQRALGDAGVPVRPDLVRLRPHGRERPRSRATCSGSRRRRPRCSPRRTCRRWRCSRPSRPSASGCRTIFRWSGSTTSNWPATRA